MRRFSCGAQRGGRRFDRDADLAAERAEFAHRAAGAGGDRRQQIVAAPGEQRDEVVDLLVEGLRRLGADAGDLVGDFVAARAETGDQVGRRAFDQPAQLLDPRDELRRAFDADALHMGLDRFAEIDGVTGNRFGDLGAAGLQLGRQGVQRRDNLVAEPRDAAAERA